jgi:FlaG/FlaF family flagellin (archaellin)
MLDIKKLMESQKAVSEVVGEVLLTTIAVLLVSSIGIFVATYDGATDVPHTQVREWMDAGNDNIYLEHSGGEFLAVKDLEIAVSINGSKYNCPPGVYSNLNDNSTWQLGDRIAINTSSEWGVDIKETDEVKVFLIDSPSKQVIQYLTVSSGEETSDWTPTTAKDNSGGNASTSDVFKSGDGHSTTYHPPSAVDLSQNQEFDFKLKPVLLGFRPGDNVTLKIVYQVKDDSCKDIRLRIWDQYPSGTWHNETGLPAYTVFTPWSRDLTYINDKEDLENLKVQLVAIENSASGSSEKVLNVDYIAICVNKNF